MAERQQKQKPAPQKTEEVEVEEQAPSTERGEKLKAELDERQKQAAWWGNKAREELAGDNEAKTVRLRVGELQAVTQDSLQFSFEMAATETSAATARVSPSIACLEAAYAAMYGAPAFAAIDATLTTRPHFASTIIGTTARMQ